MLDYDKLANAYARHRRVHPRVLESLIEQGKVGRTSQVVEVGCGTGNYISALHTATGCTGFGIDPSTEMLAKAQGRASKVNFQIGRAEKLGFQPDTFNLVFSVDAIHHVKNRAAYFEQAHQVLRADGRICTVTDSEWIIRNRQPLATYFPETIDADLRRYPRIAELRDLMHKTGFAEIEEIMVSFSYALDDIQPYRDRAFSCLHLISEETFRRGIVRMEEELQTGPLQCISRYVLLWGTKRQ